VRTRENVDHHWNNADIKDLKEFFFPLFSFILVFQTSQTKDSYVLSHFSRLALKPTIGYCTFKVPAVNNCIS